MAASSTPRAPGARALVALILLGVANLAWAIFLWRELWVARAGGEVFCLLGRPASCAALWDSPVAASVRDLSGLPVAAWGVVWGALALGLPLLLWLRGSTLVLGAAVATAAAGVGAVFGLAGASALSGQLCPNCVVSYAGVGAWAALVLAGTRGLPKRTLLQGSALAAVLAALGWAVALLPAAHTPLSGSAARAAVLARVGAAAGPLDLRLAAFVDGLGFAERRELGRALVAFNDAELLEPRAPRALLGAAAAPVRLTEFTDTLCGHCAGFHELVDQLRKALPDAFALEERQFPLDLRCNPNAGSRDDPGEVRCRAALARICMEDSTSASDFTGELYAHQSSLTAGGVVALGARFQPRERLLACMDSRETSAKLADDIDWAMQHDIRGTPLLLVNGRRAAPVPVFLYAIILAGGDPEHPAFTALW